MSFTQQITFLYTKDLDLTARFYEDILELPLALDQGGCRIYRISSDGYIGFCTHRETNSQNGIVLTLVTDDVDDWYRRLNDKGVSTEAPPAHNPKYKIYHFFFQDPNGYLLEIQRFDDPLK